MSEKLRIGFEGTLEEASYKEVTFSDLSLPQPDPFEGSFYRTETRMTLEGSEEVRIRVIPPYPTTQERDATTVQSVVDFLKQQSKGEQ